MMLETALVNYAVPGELPSFTHSHDAAYSSPNNILIYAWGTCVNLIPPYLSDPSTLTQVESIKMVKICYILVSWSVH